MPGIRPPEERFWEKVDRTGDCWLWTAGLARKGYGIFWAGDRFERAHRFSFKLANGLIPDGMQVDHRTTCPKNCVNPEHLRLATNKQNEENRAGPQANNHGSGVRGVYWHKGRQKWYVQVQHYGVRHHGGYFLPDDLDAAEARAIELRNQLFTHNDVDRQ